MTPVLSGVPSSFPDPSLLFVRFRFGLEFQIRIDLVVFRRFPF